MEFVQIDRKDGLAIVTITREAKLNALNAGVVDDLETAFREMHADDGIRVVILTGAGEKAFVAGADINELAENDAVQSNRHAQFGQAVMDKLEQLLIHGTRSLQERLDSKN